MLFCKALGISYTKIMRSSVEAVAMIIQRERMTATGSYDTVNSTPSSMDDPYAHVLDYISY